MATMADKNPTVNSVAYGPELEPHQIVLRPLVTEKGTHLSTHKNHNAYTFEVHPLADKLQIRDAVEKLFNVTVLKVRTMNRLGKKKRYRGEMGKLANWKKAIVTLSENDKIDFI
jgi:large subunit ribosomal protein L23